MFPSFVPVRMRSKVVLFLLINIIIVGFLLRSVWTLLTLLVVDGADDAISRAELPAPNSELIDGMPRLIPKIIHQTYANESVPEVWQEAQQSCVTLHQDYEYKVRCLSSPVQAHSKLTLGYSSGRTSRPVNSLPTSIHGSLKPGTRTHTPSSVQTPSGTLSSRTMAVSMWTSTMCVSSDSGSPNSRLIFS